ncbi:MAG: peptidyl-prolyl cis-trans isomerase D [Porticoccaceae bacterium]|jgi:peptidyl-prolyl cis-trans isomerase D
MAILSKIRERSVFLILIIGLALLAFVLDPSSLQNLFQANKVDVVGEVNGETISREDFAAEVEQYKARYARASNQQAINFAWDKMVGEKIYADQLEKAGIVVGAEDVWNTIITMPFFTNGPEFKNEAGLFDQEKVKEYIASIKDEALNAPKTSQEAIAWNNWLRTEAGIKENLEIQTMNNLVKAGLGASLKEGHRDYKFNNEKVSAKYVFVPYASIADSSITISNADYTTYIRNNANEFKVEESRDLKLVKFNILPSEKDKEDLKKVLTSYIDDNEKFGTKGLRNATDYETFMEDAKSDLPLNNVYVFKSKLPATISEAVFTGKEGDVVGPYQENGFYKISKIADFMQLPDSVEASYITVGYRGSQRSTSLKTKEQAEKTADSILRLVKNSSSKFAEIANIINEDNSKGKGGELGWVSKEMAFSPNFDSDFAAYLFENKKGTVQVVETQFGYQIIKIEDQKNYQKASKLVTLSRQILASVETENFYYQNAETFSSNLVNGGDFDALAKESSYTVLPAIGIKVLDENVPGLAGSQRQIVNWAFNGQNKLNSVKRFDVDNGYVVALLNGKTPKGLSPVSNVVNRIKPILINKKKAELIAAKMKGATLEEIASNNGVNVSTASNVSLASPTLSGVGSEPIIVGAMMGSSEGELVNKLAGVKGVFAFDVIGKQAAVELPNYESARKKIADKTQLKSNSIYNSLKSSYDLSDNRAQLY